MDTLIRAAVEKAATIKAVKGATKEIDPGTYEIDCTVEIAGTITKGESYDEHQSNRVNWRGAFVRSALDRGLIRLVKVPGRKLPRLRFRDKEARRIFTDMIRALDAGFETAEQKAEQKAAEKALGRWFDRVMDKTLMTHTGKTTCSLSVSEVLPEPYAVETEVETPVEA